MGLRKTWKNIKSAPIYYWRPTIALLLALVFVVGLLFYGLGNLTSGFNGVELSTRASSTSLNNIIANPLYLPSKLILLSWQHFHHYGFIAMRSPGSLIGLVVVVCFYYVLSRWYTHRIAVLGSLLLATSSWFLHAARLATFDSTFWLLFVFFACGVWLQQTKNKGRAMLACCITAAVLLYVPGMIWFLIPAVIWQRRRIGEGLDHLSIWQMFLLSILALALVTPLAWAFRQSPWLYKTWLGLPDQWPGPAQFALNLLRLPMHIFLRAPADAARWLDHLALLDWFGTVMFIIGAYSLWLKLYLDRTWLIIYIAIAGSILVALNGSVSIAIFLPFIYLIIVGGVALMLQQWFTVFPRNPFARSLGATLLIVAVIASCFYQTQHYFIAWPHTPETKAAFSERP